MKFIFVTQLDALAIYTGASGQNYTIERGKPFEVANKLDQEMFLKNTRFNKVTIIDKVIKALSPVEEPAEENQEFKDILAKIHGLSKADEKLLIEIYGDLRTLIEHYQGFGKDGIDTKISSRGRSIIANRILDNTLTIGGIAEEDTSDEETNEDSEQNVLEEDSEKVEDSNEI